MDLNQMNVHRPHEKGSIVLAKGVVQNQEVQIHHETQNDLNSIEEIWVNTEKSTQKESNSATTECKELTNHYSHNW